MPNGTFRAIDLDVASGVNNTGRTACWLDFSDENTFFVSNAIEAGLAAYSFNDGNIELINQVAAQGTGATGNTTDPAAAFSTTEGWIDMWISDDGQYLYQLYGLGGVVGVYSIDGTSLTLVEEIRGDLPLNNTQGIVAVGPPSQSNTPETTARYRLTFDAAWSRVSHPYEFPFDARWSPVAGLTHDSSIEMFTEGEAATQGIVNMSQTGSRDPLNSEIEEMIAGGGGEYLINAATRVNPSPDTITTTFEISSSHPYVSLTSMIAPSPDWFVALRGLNLFENGEWVESTAIQFKPYDSGSDDGISFASPNQNTDPREGIYPITDGPLFANGEPASLGIWRLERIDDASDCNVAGGSLVGGPFEFCVDGEADNIPEGALTVQGSIGSNQIIVTDDKGYILGLPPTFSAPDFDAAGVGLCFIYNMAYDGPVGGLEVGSNIEDLTGCFSLSNSTYVNRRADEQICEEETTASYRVIFDAAWSPVTHPVDFPTDGRWSPVAGITHDSRTSMFLTGSVASQGIVNMSQERIIGQGGAETLINATTRVNPSPDTVSFTFDISSSHPYVSMTSMIAPSPDWFVALRGLNLYEGGEWAESRIAQFKPYDSGSDDGESFESANQNTDPREGIYPIIDGPLFTNGESASLGIWRIERIDGGSACDVSGGSLVGGPFTYCVDGVADHIGADELTVENARGAQQIIVTDDKGYILGLPGAFSGPNFDAAGVGLCFIYNMAYEGPVTGLAVGNNIADLGGCFNLSNSTYVLRVDDNCPFDCAAPQDFDVRVKSSRRLSKTTINWESPANASGYIVEARFVGSTSALRVDVRRSRITILAPAAREIEFRVQTICEDGSVSEYTDWMPGISTGSSANNRSSDQGFDFSADISLGLGESTTLKVYPNPVSDLLNLEYTITSDSGTLSIYNISGQRTMFKPLSKGDQIHRVGTAELNDGMYIIEIREDGEAPVISRFIKGLNR